MNDENDEHTTAAAEAEIEANERKALEGVRGLVRGSERNTEEISELNNELRHSLRRVLHEHMNNENQQLRDDMAQLTIQLDNAIAANDALTRENRRVFNENRRFNNENQRLRNALTNQNLQITNCPRTNHAPSTVITKIICHQCEKTTPVIMHNPRFCNTDNHFHPITNFFNYKSLLSKQNHDILHLIVNHCHQK